jgi:hypothetical protein
MHSMGTRSLDLDQLRTMIHVLGERVGPDVGDPKKDAYAKYMATYLRIHARHANRADARAAFLRLSVGELDALADWLEELVERRSTSRGSG